MSFPVAFLLFPWVGILCVCHCGAVNHTINTYSTTELCPAWPSFLLLLLFYAFYVNMYVYVHMYVDPHTHTHM